MYLEQNIRGLCDKFGIQFEDFLTDLEVEEVRELSIDDLEVVAEEYDTDVHALLFKRSYHESAFRAKMEAIKLLVIDVDGVMTDGGMYFTESGDQFKKFNTKDGMGIIHLTRDDFQVAIISSGFKGAAVKARAELLGIQNCYVGRESKLEILKGICKEQGLSLDEVAIIGDDINDMEVMRNVGMSFCPKDAVDVVKSTVDVILSKKGGEGCVRELIDQYILKKPLEK
ncbi:MAG: HAD hydrolase family protein [Crocinitomicaceae bacterium]|nr:HAD hydrolase family protein [Crocinitomicaceae bacterium]